MVGHEFLSFRSNVWDFDRMARMWALYLIIMDDSKGVKFLWVDSVF